MTKVALSVSPAGQVTLARWALGWTNDQLVVGRYQPSWVPALIISLLTKVQSCVTITQHALIKGSFANFMPLTAPPPSPAFTTVRSFSKLNSRHPSTQHCTTYKTVHISLRCVCNSISAHPNIPRIPYLHIPSPRRPSFSNTQADQIDPTDSIGFAVVLVSLVLSSKKGQTHTLCILPSFSLCVNCEPM